MKTPEYKTYKYKMMVAHDGKMQLIWYKDIVCIKADGDYIDVLLSSSAVVHSLTESLSRMEAQLPKIFFRCHRSAIVNIAYVDSVGKDRLLTTTQLALPVSRSRLNLLKQMLMEPDRLKVPNCHHCEQCAELETCPEVRPFTVHG